MGRKKKKKKIVKAVNTKRGLSLSLGLESDVIRGVWSIVLIAIAIILSLSFLNFAGATGETINDALEESTGFGRYVIPSILVVLAVLFIKFDRPSAIKRAILSSVIFFSSIVGILDIINVFDGDGGGYWGAGFAYFFVEFLGAVVATIILVSIAIIFVLIGLNVPLSHVIKSLFSLFKRKEKSIYKEESGEEEVVEKRSIEQQPVATPNIKPSISSLGDDPKQKDDSFLKTPSFTPLDGTPFDLPPFDLLEKDSKKPISGDIESNALTIKQTLKTFGIDVEVGEVSVGPTVTQYTMKPKEGTKLSRITALSNDLALSLAAEALRIEAPIPGKSLVGIEMPNKTKATVRLRDLIERREFQDAGNLAIALGRDVSGKAMYADLSKMPHLLIAGSTGSGKTIALTSVIVSLLYRNTPEQLRLLLIDPKRVEFTVYANIPHLLAPVVTESTKAINALKWAVSEMERRFDMLSRVGCRDITSYHANKKAIEQEGPLPYLAVIIDELADLMSSKGKEVEALVVRIAQLARAAGIHLILATQRPSVEVITGTIKANLPARMAFQVASQIDSRTILDMAGAEKLIGKGDMLFLGPQDAKPVRIQGAFVSDSEAKKIADHLRSQAKEVGVETGIKDLEVEEKTTQQKVDFDNIDASAEDDLYEEARQIVIKSRKASASLLQRRLRVGYARAARLLDLLEENNVIGPADGAKPRDVYVEDEGSI